MTAEDARRSVEALSQLLRDEVAEAMGDAHSGGSQAGGSQAGGSRVGVAHADGARLGLVRSSNTDSPAWLTTGEEQLARALRVSRPGDYAESRSDFWRHRARFRTWVLAALVVSGIGVGAGLSAWQNQAKTEGPALAFRTDEDPPNQLRRSGRIIAPADRAEEVRFSDGSRLSLSAGSMLRVRETDTHGAMVIVEEGQVESSIQHTGSARWSVFAGPYEVRVVGTRFATTWDPGRQRLSVVLHQGSVQVLGKGIDELVELKPGQRFESGGTEGQWFVTATADTPTDPSAADSTGGVDPNGGVDSMVMGHPDVDGSSDALSKDASATARGTKQSDEARTPFSAGPGRAFDEAEGVSWSTLVAHGRFEEVLDEASVRGEAACIQSCSIADLRALADAARYTGRFSLAERMLEQLRSRAPSEGPRAGFLLGSMNEAQGRPAAALEWYGRYLGEAPSGGLAAEARAGRMRALLALGQTEAAKAAAKDYLRLHPAGVGAATARQILLRP